MSASEQHGIVDNRSGLHRATRFYSSFVLWTLDLFFVYRGAVEIWHRFWIFGFFLVVCAQLFPVIGAELTNKSRIARTRNQSDGKKPDELSGPEMNFLSQAVVSAGLLIAFMVFIMILHAHKGFLRGLLYGAGAWLSMLILSFSLFAVWTLLKRKA